MFSGISSRGRYAASLAAGLALAAAIMVGPVLAGAAGPGAAGSHPADMHATYTNPGAQAVDAHGAGHADAHAAVSATARRAAFHDAMRKLWEDHITWTRLFIVSFATQTSPLADLGPTTDRLLANQTDIGNAIKPFYGAAAGDQLTALLRTHILLAAQILTAAKAGDGAGVNTAVTAWYANANDIAAFLHDANPDAWPLADLQSMMKSHLDLTLQEAVDRLHGDYAADIADYDSVHAEILGMADMLSDGIVAQFPQAFAH